MTRITEPEELHRAFAERANASDLEGMLALYEDSATLVAIDGTRAHGTEEVRVRLMDLLAIAPQIIPTGSETVIAGDIALIRSRWRMTIAAGARDAGFEGTSAEVARRQSDGAWLYTIDAPALVPDVAER